jgi:hypothetical protein
MSWGRVAVTFIVGVVAMTVWVAWLIMLTVGTLAGLDVVNGTVSFVESIPLGLGLVGFGLLPLLSLLVMASESDNPPSPDAKKPDQAGGPASSIPRRHHRHR